jgi:hypothetical protein
MQQLQTYTREIARPCVMTSSRVPRADDANRSDLSWCAKHKCSRISSGPFPDSLIHGTSWYAVQLVHRAMSSNSACHVAAPLWVCDLILGSVATTCHLEIAGSTDAVSAAVCSMPVHAPWRRHPPARSGPALIRQCCTIDQSCPRYRHLTASVAAGGPVPGYFATPTMPVSWRLRAPQDHHLHP